MCTIIEMQNLVYGTETFTPSMCASSFGSFVREKVMVRRLIKNLKPCHGEAPGGQHMGLSLLEEINKHTA